jgi:lipopolysaccharide/colanic/teichoic acid biosynthesis glycosyltransferase
LAPVTLATRADEAGGPPPSKFYERRDNLLLDVEEANRRDLELAHNWSLRRELRLVLATVRAVLYGR